MQLGNGTNVMNETKIAFVGAGNMASALIQGVLSREVCDPSSVIAAEPSEPRRARLQQAHGITVTDDNSTAVRQSDVVVLAVKPQVFQGVLEEISGALRPGALVISIAAGVPISKIERAVPTGTPVVRTMPNTPALVGEGATAIAAGTHADPAHIDRVCNLFEAVGTTIVVSESLLDAVTGLSGSGPAFVFVMIEALADAGVQEGLDRASAQKLAAQTVLGAAKLVLESGEHPGALKDRVASPAGTTIAGLRALEQSNVRAALQNAVHQAAQRSRELAKK